MAARASAADPQLLTPFDWEMRRQGYQLTRFADDWVITALCRKLLAVTDRMAGFEAELLNVHVDFSLFQRLALPITSGRTRIPGIKIQDTRMMRLMEVLLHGGSQMVGWRTAQIHEALLSRLSSLRRCLFSDSTSL